MLPNDERKIHLHLTDAFGVEGGKPDFEESMPEPGLFELTSPPGCCNLHNALWAAYQIAKGDAKPSTGALLVQSVKDFLSEVPPSAKSQAGHAMVVTLTQELPKSALSPEQGLRFASAVGDAVAQAVGPQQDGEGVTMAILRSPEGVTVLKNGQPVATVAREYSYAIAAAVVAYMAKGAPAQERAAFEALTRSMMKQTVPLKD